MASIGLLHTAAVHRPVFERLVDEVDPASRTETIVDERLLALARRAGPDDPSVVAAVRERLVELAGRDVDAIICTCSTIGAVAESCAAAAGVAVVRVDRPMVEAAVAHGGRIAVIAAVESTVGPTSELIAAVAGELGVTVEATTILVPGAWERFEADDLAGYHELVADAIVSVGDGAEVVVLAQASMAPAAEMAATATPVLSSPRAAITSLLEVDRSPDP